MRTVQIAVLLFLAWSPISAQSTDSQTLQSLLQEIRQIRSDLYNVTLVAQRVQILLYRIHLQDEATKKQAVRYDEISLKLKDAERNRIEAATALKETEERLSSVQNPVERRTVEENFRELKKTAEMWASEESSYRAAEAAAAGELRKEESKLLELQQRLDQMEKQLENTSRPAPAR